METKFLPKGSNLFDEISCQSETKVKVKHLL
jgi:hypothetical protein